MHPPSKNKKLTRRPAVCWAATFSGIVLSIANLIMAMRSGATVRGPGDLVFGLLFSLWVGLPLLLLGQVKLSHRRPRVVLVLWLVGLLVTVKMLHEVFVDPSGSTTALGLLTTPFYLILGFSLIGLFQRFLDRSPRGRL